MAEDGEALRLKLEQQSRELKASETRFRNVISRNADGIIIVGRDGILRFVNPAAGSLFDREPEELVGAAFGFPIVVGETTEIDLVRRGGLTTAAEMRVVETEWEGEPVYLATLRDVTDRRRAEAQRAELIREQVRRAEAEAASARLEFLAEASELLAGSRLSYEATLQSLARLAVPFLADFCIVDMVEESGELRQVAVAHIDPAKEGMLRDMRRRYPFDMNSPTGVTNVIRTGRPEMVTEVDRSWLDRIARDQEHLRLMREVDFSSFIIVPMQVNDQTLGAISLVLTGPDRRYGQSDLALAEDLAHRAALAVDNARLYRETEEACRLKDEFLATVSHELRTPLNAILGWARILSSGMADGEEAVRAIETIERNARSQAQIVEDLLDVSRIITGKLSLRAQPVDVISVIESAVEAMRPAAEAKVIRLIFKTDNSRAMISGDRDRLQQIVWNLLSNALKFTPKGGTVEIRVALVDSDVQIVVSDTGRGINRKFLPYVFDRFRQADSSSTREHGGLGLGLAIVRNLVEMHGGAVRVDSAGEGMGATFTVSLPVIENTVACAEPRSEAPADEVDDSASILEGLRVLVVDDDPDAVELLDLILARCGAEVITASNAYLGIEAVRMHRPDVIVSDIGMPGADGYEMIQQVRAMETDGRKKIPAVAITAYARSEDRNRALAAGFQMHMPKPIEPNTLVTIVADLAGRAVQPERD